MKDIRLELKVKNNRILLHMELCGFSSVAEMCREASPDSNIQSSVGRIIAMKDSPFLPNGEWRRPVRMIAKAMRVCPEELFSEEILNTRLDENVATMQMDVSEVQRLTTGRDRPDLLLESSEMSSELRALMSRALTENENTVIRLRYCLRRDDAARPTRGHASALCAAGGDSVQRTYEEIANRLGVSRERIRQMEIKAMKKLRRKLGHVRSFGEYLSKKQAI